jgi:hypothetical protein
MKRSFHFPLTLLGLILTMGPIMAQYRQADRKDSVTRLLRIYEDNDGINIFGQSTDDAYTNGTRIDLFYQPAHRPHGLLGRFAPDAGQGSFDIYSWGLMQLMYTPQDISKSGFQPHDYPYSGAMVATHGRYSYNPIKKYGWQTEVVMGALGPLSLAHQTQSIVHHLTGFIQPMGWGTQYHNALLLNVNLGFEKEIAAAGDALQVIGGVRAMAGTMQNGAGLYSLILIGKKNSWFNGLFSQYSGYGANGRRKWQIYFQAKPELQFVLTNALLQGGMFSSKPKSPKTGTVQEAPVRQWVQTFSYGGVLSHGDFSVSFVQNVSSATIEGLYCHDVGNVSLYFGW